MYISLANPRYSLVIPKDTPKPKYLSFTHELQDRHKSILLELSKLLNLRFNKKRKLQQRFLESKLRALELVIVNIISKTKLDINQQVFISYRSQTFTDTHCNYRQFIEVMKYLEDNGLIIRVKGKKKTYPFDNTKWNYYSASIISITERFINLCACIQINKINYQSYFKTCLPKYFISARYESNLIHGKKVRGKKLSIRQLKLIPKFNLLNDEMSKINKYISKQNLENCEFYGLVRNFNIINNEHSFSYGGRIQAVGNNNFQTLKKEQRKKILINGKSVVEIDIKGSHLTIFCALLGVQIENRDPYQISSLHRDIVKEWVNISLSISKYCERWPVGVKKRLLEKGHNLKKLTAKKAGLLILNDIPILKKLYNAPSGWGFLQFVESCILMETIKELNKAKIIALPVHDSLIVENSHIEAAKKILNDVFYKKLNARPILN